MTDPYESHTRLAGPSGSLSRGLRYLHTAWLRIAYPFACIGENVSVHFISSIKRTAAHRISLGNSVSIEKDARLSVSLPAGHIGQPVIVIEDNCILHWRSQIFARNRVHLERAVVVSQDAFITDHGRTSGELHRSSESAALNSGTIRIGQGSWIGHGAAVICMEGELVLGQNCVVAAGSVVTESAPPYSILSGNPARVIKRFGPAEDSQGAARLERSR